MRGSADAVDDLFGVQAAGGGVGEHRDFFGDDVERDHFVVLGEEDGVGEADVAGSGDGDFHKGRFKVQGTRKIRFDAHT